MYNSHYEKILATGEVKCIDEEIPFEIPERWEWTRMGCVGDWGSGSTPHRGNQSYYGGNILWLKTGELNNSIVYDTEEKITEKALTECSLRMNKLGDVLIAMYGATIGKIAIVGKELTTNQACCGCSPILIYNYYLFYFLMASRTDFIKQGEGGAQPNISREKLVRYFIPIPPLAEQKRIVDKIEELLPLIDKYSCLQTTLETHDNGINNQLKKSILQYAIQGKLVPQIDTEEPATILLEKIRSEKLQLLKEGKLKKKDIQDSVIFKDDDNRYYEKVGNEMVCIDDELPFDIPQTWTWINIGALFYIQTGASFKKEQANSMSKGVRILRGGNISPDYYSFKDDDIFIDESLVTPSILLRKNDLITPAVTSLENVGKMARVLEDYDDVSAGGFVFILRPHLNNEVHSQYLCAAIQSPYLINTIKSITKKSGSAFYNIGKERLVKLYLPLPPLAEQSRIVNALNSVLKSIEGL